MFSVFILYFPAEASRIPCPPHCNRSRLIAFIVLTGFRNRKLINGASLSPVYFVSACFLPSHLSVYSHFICHNSARYLFLFLYLHAFISIIFCSCTCRNESFTCPLNVLYLFLRVLSRLSVTWVLLSSPLRFLQFLFPEISRVLIHFRARCRALSISGANYERRVERFADSASVITMFMAIIRFRRNY